MQQITSTCRKDCVNRHLRSRSNQINASTTSLYEKLTNGPPTIDNAQTKESQVFEIAYFQKELLANRKYYMNQVKMKDERIKVLELEIKQIKAQLTRLKGNERLNQTKSLHQQFQEMNMTPPPKPVANRKLSQQNSSEQKSKQKSTDFRLQLERARQELKREKDAQIRDLKKKYDGEIRDLYKTVKQLSNEKFDYLRYSKQCEQLRNQLKGAKQQLELAKRNAVKRIQEINQKDQQIEELKRRQSHEPIDLEINRQKQQMRFLHAQNMEVKAILKDYEDQLSESNEQKRQLVLRYQEYIESLTRSHQEKHARGNIQIKENFEQAIKYKELAQQLEKENQGLRREIQKVHEDYQTQINSIDARQRSIVEKYQKILKEHKKKIQAQQINYFYISETIYQSFLEMQEFKSFFSKESNGNPRKVLGQLDLGRIVKNISVRYQNLRQQLEKVKSQRCIIQQRATALQQQGNFLQNKLKHVEVQQQKHQLELLQEIQKLHLALRQADIEQQAVRRQDYQIQMLRQKISEMEKNINILQHDKLQTGKIIQALTTVREKLQESLSVCQNKYEQIVSIKNCNEVELNKLLHSYEVRVKQIEINNGDMQSLVQILKQSNFDLNDKNQKLRDCITNFQQKLAQAQKTKQQALERLKSQEQQKSLLISSTRRYLQGLIINKTKQMNQKLQQLIQRDQKRIQEIILKQNLVQNALQTLKRPIAQQIFCALNQANQKYDELVENYVGVTKKYDIIKLQNHQLRCQNRNLNNFQFKSEICNFNNQQKHKLLQIISNLECQKLEYQRILEKSAERIRDYIQKQKSYKNIFGHLRLQIQTHSQIFQQGSLEESSFNLYTGIQTALKGHRQSNEKIVGLSNINLHPSIMKQSGFSLNTLMKQMKNGGRFEEYQNNTKNQQRRFLNSKAHRLAIQGLQSQNTVQSRNIQDLLDPQKTEYATQSGRMRYNQLKSEEIQVINIQNISFAYPNSSQTKTYTANYKQSSSVILQGKECFSKIQEDNQSHQQEFHANNLIQYIQDFQKCYSKSFLEQQEELQANSIYQNENIIQSKQELVEFKTDNPKNALDWQAQRLIIGKDEQIIYINTLRREFKSDQKIGQYKVDTKQSQVEYQNIEKYLSNDSQNSSSSPKEEQCNGRNGKACNLEKQKSARLQIICNKKKRKRRRNKRRR